MLTPKLVLPGEDLLIAMGKYNEELVNSGVLLAGDGLQDSAKGARVNFKGGKHTVVDSPFAEVKELVTGFWMIQVASKDEAVAWAEKVPFGDAEGQIEVRQVFEMDAFDDIPETVEGKAALEWEKAARSRDRLGACRLIAGRSFMSLEPGSLESAQPR